MILEVAVFKVKTGEGERFEAAFQEASKIISSMTGHVSHELQRCIEVADRYVLLVRWKTLEDHTVGFRNSKEFQEWRRLLQHFFESLPTVEHYEGVPLE